MLQDDDALTPTQFERLRERALCLVLLVAAVSVAAVFLLPRVLPWLG